MSPNRPPADGTASSPSLVMQARPNPRSFFVRDPLPSTEMAAEASPSPGPSPGSPRQHQPQQSAAHVNIAVSSVEDTGPRATSLEAAESSSCHKHVDSLMPDQGVCLGSQPLT